MAMILLSVGGDGGVMYAPVPYQKRQPSAGRMVTYGL